VIVSIPWRSTPTPARSAWRRTAECTALENNGHERRGGVIIDFIQPLSVWGWVYKEAVNDRQTSLNFPCFRLRLSRPLHEHFSLNMFKSLAVFASLLAAASTQTISIGYPANGAEVTSGSNITVEVDKPVCIMRLYLIPS
jgi:hypothetical protein